MAARPIADNLVTDEPEPRLIGGKDRSTGRIVFPYPSGGEAARYEPVALSRTGTVWSWTVQRFRPKSPPYAGPAAFAPYVMAYVELPGETIVASRLVDIEPEAVTIGMAVEMTMASLDPQAPDGPAIPVFRPAGATS